ncbi:Uncharacterised protein [Escherichia coli]|nr:Uncharacterised protein [Escherichia coli]
MAGFLQSFVKASQELFPVICDDLADTGREQPGCTAEKVIDDITVERRHSQRQCIIAVFVDHGNDIATHFTHSELNGVHPNELTGLYRTVVLWPAGFGGSLFDKQSLTPRAQTYWYHPHFIVCGGNHSADGRNTRAGQMALCAPGLQANKNLLFTEVWQLCPEASNLFQHIGMPVLFSSHQRSFTVWD